MAVTLKGHAFVLVLISFTTFIYISCAAAAANTKPGFFVAKLIRNPISPFHKYGIDDIRAGLMPDPSGFLHLAEFSIGTPPVKTLAVMDTGSDLFWIQCLPCDRCFNQTTPYFDPSKSSTFSDVNCESQYCSYLSRRPCDPSYRCGYRVAYRDTSYTKGNLAQEALTFETNGGGNFTIPNVIFSFGNGVLGLGPGKLSVLSRLGNQPKFSYCFKNISDSSYGGHLILGDGANINGYTTPLANGSDVHYYLILLDISVGQVRLNIPPGTFDRQPSGNGGVVIDSGATMTYLAKGAYNMLVEELTKLLDQFLRPVTVPGYNLCYEGSVSRDLSGFLTITFHFADGADLQVEHWNFFRQGNEGAFCLTIMPTTYAGVSIIGNLVQQGYNVGYDLVKNVVSFEYIDCSVLESRF